MPGVSANVQESKGQSPSTPEKQTQREYHLAFRRRALDAGLCRSSLNQKSDQAMGPALGFTPTRLMPQGSATTKRFFALGKVFKILWLEPATYTARGQTCGTKTREFDDFVNTKVRRFVAVKCWSQGHKDTVRQTQEDSSTQRVICRHATTPRFSGQTNRKVTFMDKLQLHKSDLDLGPAIIMSLDMGLGIIVLRGFRPFSFVNTASSRD